MTRLLLIFLLSCRSIPEAYYIAGGHVHDKIIDEPIEIVLGEERVIINATLYEVKKVLYYKTHTVYELPHIYLIHQNGVLSIFRYDDTRICTIIKMIEQ